MPALNGWLPWTIRSSAPHHRLMPNFAPCRVGQDFIVHLTSPDDPQTTLCGQPVDQPTPALGDSNACPSCAKKLVRRIFRLADAAGIGSITVEIHRPGQQEDEPL